MWVVYGLRFVKPGHRRDGAIRYIGQTSKPLAHRWRGHIADSKRFSSALQRAIRKYGDGAFLIEELERCATRELANERERLLIDEHRTRVSHRTGGLNVASGGQGVDYSDPVVRARHRASLGPAWRAAASARLKAKNADPEFRAKQAAAMRRESVRAVRSAVAKEVNARPEHKAKARALCIARNTKGKGAAPEGTAPTRSG